MAAHESNIKACAYLLDLGADANAVGRGTARTATHAHAAHQHTHARTHRTINRAQFKFIHRWRRWRDPDAPCGHGMSTACTRPVHATQVCDRVAPRHCITYIQIYMHLHTRLDLRRANRLEITSFASFSTSIRRMCGRWPTVSFCIRRQAPGIDTLTSVVRWQAAIRPCISPRKEGTPTSFCGCLRMAPRQMRSMRVRLFNSILPLSYDETG